MVALAVDLSKYMLPCLNKKLLGIPCPGCGMQRSVALLYHGEFWAAFKMYPAIYPLGLLLAVLLTNTFFKLRYANQLISGLSIVSVGLILINYIINLTV